MGLLDFVSNLFGNNGRGDDTEPLDDPGATAADGPTDDDPPDAESEKPVEEYGAAEFREEAEEFAERHEDHDLDFTVDSLARLDDVAEEHGAVLGLLGGELDDGDDFVARMEGGYTLWLGSYLGEVLVRQFGGEWADDEGWAVAVPVDGGSYEVPVFDVAAHSIADEPVLHDVATELEDGLESAARADGVDRDADTEMAAEAEELAAFWSERDLDFTPASLSRLDDLVDEQWDKQRFREAELGDTGTMDGRVLTGLVTQLGSYYGEVLVRTLDAEWTRHDDVGTAVEVAGSDGEEAWLANVFHIAEDCLTEPSKFALNYDVIVDRLDLDAPGAGGDGHAVVVDLEEAEDLDAADVVAGFAEDAEELVAGWPGYDLDYSPESLSRLDDLVDEEFAGLDFEGVELGDGTDGDSLFLTAHAMETGAYLAEVLRRRLGAEWRHEDGTTLVVEGGDAEAHLDPVAIAAACFRGEDSFVATFEAVRGRLGLDVDGA